jgi:hypothetical protein
MKAPPIILGAIVSGNDGQRADRMAGPGEGFTGMEQWCLPSRRQHAGRFESESVDTAGLISETLKKARSKLAQSRRKRLSYLRRCAILLRRSSAHVQPTRSAGS